MWLRYLKPALDRQREMERKPSLDEEEATLQLKKQIESGEIETPTYELEDVALWLKANWGLEPTIVQKENI